MKLYDNDCDDNDNDYDDNHHRRRSPSCSLSRSSTSSWTTTRLTTWTRTRLKAQISMLGSFVQKFFSDLQLIPKDISIYSCTFSRTVSILRMVSRQLIMFDIDIASFSCLIVVVVEYLYSQYKDTMNYRRF